MDWEPSCVKDSNSETVRCCKGIPLKLVQSFNYAIPVIGI